MHQLSLPFRRYEVEGDINVSDERPILLHSIPAPVDSGSGNANPMGNSMKKVYDRSFWLDQEPYYKFRDHELEGQDVETCLKPCRIGKVFSGVLEEDIMSSWMRFYIQQGTPFVVTRKGKMLLMWRGVNLLGKNTEAS